MGSAMRMPQSLKLPMFVGASTVTVTLCEPPAAILPEVSLTWHQVAVLPGTPDAVQFRVAEPVFFTVRVWPGGVAPPETPEKEKVVGERVMCALGTGFTVKAVPLKVQLVAPFGV